MIGTKDGVPQPVADSFEEFLRLYLVDSPRLYPSP